MWLRYTCAAHGTVTTAYCANAAFFRRMLSFVDEEASSSSASSAAAAASASPIAGNARRPPLRDLEDLLNIRPASTNLPLMVEMDLSRGAELLPDAQVCGGRGGGSTSLTACLCIHHRIILIIVAAIHCLI